MTEEHQALPDASSSDIPSLGTSSSGVISSETQIPLATLSESVSATQDIETLAKDSSTITSMSEAVLETISKENTPETASNEPSPTLTFHLLPETFAIMRFPPEIVKGMPEFIFESSFYTISRSSNEISIVCEERLVVRHTDHYGLGNLAKISSNWRIMRLGVMDLSLTGIAAHFASVLAEREVNLNIIATYDTDYVMVPQAKLSRAIKALREAGYTVD